MFICHNVPSGHRLMEWFQLKDHLVPTPLPWAGMFFTRLLFTRSLMLLDILFYSGFGSDVWISLILWHMGTDESFRKTELSQERMLLSANDHKILCCVSCVSREVVKQNEAPVYSQVQGLIFRPIFLLFFYPGSICAWISKIYINGA